MELSGRYVGHIIDLLTEDERNVLRGTELDRIVDVLNLIAERADGLASNLEEMGFGVDDHRRKKFGFAPQHPGFLNYFIIGNNGVVGTVGRVGEGFVYTLEKNFDEAVRTLLKIP